MEEGWGHGADAPFCDHCSAVEPQMPEVAEPLSVLGIEALSQVSSAFPLNHFGLHCRCPSGLALGQAVSSASGPRTSPCLPSPHFVELPTSLGLVKFPSYKLKKRIRIIICMKTRLHFAMQRVA